MAQYFGMEIDSYIFNQTVMKKHYVSDFGGGEDAHWCTPSLPPPPPVCVHPVLHARVCVRAVGNGE